MAALVTYEIRVYPLVKKFLEYHYNTQPFEVSAYSNAYSTYLCACLDRYDHRDTQQPKRYSQLTDRLTVGVAGWRVKTYGGAIISPAKQGTFNDFVKQMFFESLTTDVTLRMALHGAGIKEAISRFLNRYGITEDELSILTAMRYYGRYRRRMLSDRHTSLECCPVSPAPAGVILPHERDSAYGQVESGWRAVA